jgi:hypothetical protein
MQTYQGHAPMLQQQPAWVGGESINSTKKGDEMRGKSERSLGGNP